MEPPFYVPAAILVWGVRVKGFGVKWDALAGTAKVVGIAKVANGNGTGAVSVP